jgi:hypothetical protein
VKLQGQLAIGALDLLLAGASRHSQHLVVVSFYVARQNGIPRIRSDFRLLSV